MPEICIMIAKNVYCIETGTHCKFIKQLSIYSRKILNHLIKLFYPIEMHRMDLAKNSPKKREEEYRDRVLVVLWWNLWTAWRYAIFYIEHKKRLFYSQGDKGGQKHKAENNRGPRTSSSMKWHRSQMTPTEKLNPGLMPSFLWHADWTRIPSARWRSTRGHSESSLHLPVMTSKCTGFDYSRCCRGVPALPKIRPRAGIQHFPERCRQHSYWNCRKTCN